MTPRHCRLRHGQCLSLSLLCATLAYCCISLLRTQSIVHWQHSNSTLKTSLVEFKQAFSDTNRTVSQSTKHKYCLEHRGENGHWQYDENYAAAHQYATYGNFPSGMIANQRFVPSPNRPYRSPTVYRWIDSTCDIATLSREGFCRVMQALRANRLYVAGDSMSEGFMTSLRSLLGYPKWGSSQFVRRHWNVPACEEIWNWTVSTLFRRVTTDNTDFTLFFQQNDVRIHRKDFLVDNPGRNLIVVNVGAHIHSIDNFTQSVKSLLRSLDDLQRPGDLIFVRNTAPGHHHCRPGDHLRHVNWTTFRDDVPYANHHEYLVHEGNETNAYAWHLFVHYNAIVDRLLAHRRRQQQQQATNASTPILYRLNIYNATVLRRDGHVGHGDCLHYSFPGPIDWWVHLWYSQLLDILHCERLQNLC
jgi:hypothetical protein